MYCCQHLGALSRNFHLTLSVFHMSRLDYRFCWSRSYLLQLLWFSTPGFQVMDHPYSTYGWFYGTIILTVRQISCLASGRSCFRSQWRKHYTEENLPMKVCWKYSFHRYKRKHSTGIHTNVKTTARVKETHHNSSHQWFFQKSMKLPFFTPLFIGLN